MVVYWSTTFDTSRRTGKVWLQCLIARQIPFNLAENICKYIQALVWPFRVAKLFRYDFQTILHFVDGV